MIVGRKPSNASKKEEGNNPHISTPHKREEFL